MADFLDELASYLDDQNVGVFDTDSGRNIFVNELPNEPDTCIALLGILGETIDPDHRDVEALQFPRFQVITRAASDDYSVASTAMQTIRTKLHGGKPTLASWRILRMHADQEGGPIGRDSQGRHEFAINFTCEIHAK